MIELISIIASIAVLVLIPVEVGKIQKGWVRKNFKPAYEKLGASSDSDTPEKKELRAILFGYLGTLGKDSDVIGEAKQIAKKYLADPSSVDSTFAQAATGIAAGCDAADGEVRAVGPFA